MIISHKKRFIFVHIPKCAGTSLRTALGSLHDDDQTFWLRRFDPYFGCEIDLAHLRLWELHALFPRVFEMIAEYRTLALVRSPYERFLSALGEHFTAFRRDFDYCNATEEVLRSYVERFVERELRIERVLGDARFVHFSFQTWFIKLGDRRVVRQVEPMPLNDSEWERVFAELGIPVQVVGRSNSRGGHLRGLLREQGMLDWIEEFYKGDFDWLRRDPRLAKLTVRPAVSGTREDEGAPLP